MEVPYPFKIRDWNGFRPRLHPKFSKREGGQRNKAKPTKIKEVYKDYYEELLTTKKATTEEEKTIEKTVNKCMEAIMLKSQEIEIEPITDTEYENMKKNLKKNKAPDMEGWTYL